MYAAMDFLFIYGITKMIKELYYIKKMIKELNKLNIWQKMRLKIYENKVAIKKNSNDKFIKSKYKIYIPLNMTLSRHMFIIY